MPFLQTRDFGKLPYDPSAELAFPCGIPGFDDQRRFVIIANEAIAPVLLLQSIDTASLCFLAIAVSVLESEYQSGIGPEDLRVLGLDENRQPKPGEEALYFAILSPSGNGSFSANLLAPVVVNVATRAAVQAVRHDQLYSHRHQVPRELLGRRVERPLEHPCS
jgi:flagellar assembly factor FliW